MDINIIKNALRNITEEKVPGLSVTNKVQKDSEKTNKDYYKDVAKKMDDYTESPKKGTQPVKAELTNKEKEFVDNIRGGKGLQHVTYDLDPSKEFKDRAKKAIEGDEIMGNKVHVGEDNGNTESTWGASDDKQGEKLVARTKDWKKQTDDAQLDLIQFGDDIEVANNNKKVKRKQVAVESVDNTIKNKNKMKSKKLIYKKEFNGKENAIKLIPESYKQDGYKFQMTDGVETFDFRWEGSLNEGEAVILREANSKLISENISKMNHLFNYDSKEVIKSLDNEAKLNENEIFKALLEEGKKKVLKEDVQLNPKEKSILSDILGESDGSAYNMGDLDEQDLTEGPNFDKVLNKVRGYAKKGLLTTALIGALMAFSQKSFSQEQQSKLSQEIEQISGIKFTNDAADSLFEPYQEKEFEGKEIAKLDFGRFGKFGDKYYVQKSANFDNDGGITYKIDVNHPLYQGKKDTMKSIVKMNYKLKEKYENVTFEFYGTNGTKVGAFKI